MLSSNFIKSLNLSGVAAAWVLVFSALSIVFALSVTYVTHASRQRNDREVIAQKAQQSSEINRQYKKRE